ncbi:hypothetical protein [Rhodococcus sp. NPDC059234]|uniref:hypothetical protein n=1 Tax=Rhodococcus sp. NPDC059234 TaxID=3346781 RepID=UPI00367234D2
MKAQNTTRMALTGMGILAGAALFTPTVASAEPTAAAFAVSENSPILTTDVTGHDALVTVAPPADAQVVCMTPVVVKGKLDAQAMQKSLDSSGQKPTLFPGVKTDAGSAMVYPKVIPPATAGGDPTFEPAIRFLSSGIEKSAVATLTGLEDGSYGALTNCITPGTTTVSTYIRNFRIGAEGGLSSGSTSSSDLGSSGNGSSFGSTIGTVGSADNLFGSS